MSVIEALLAAEHDLAVLHGSTASDGPGSWTIDHAETLAKLRAALEAIGVSIETGRECASCRNRPSRTSNDRQTENRLAALEAEALDSDMQGIAGDVMRSAGYPTLLWQRVRVLEQRLRACEERLQAAEAGLLQPATLRGRFAAWLERLRIAWTVRQAELPRARAVQGKAE